MMFFKIGVLLESEMRRDDFGRTKEFTVAHVMRRCNDKFIMFMIALYFEIVAN